MQLKQLNTVQSGLCNIIL